MNSIHRLAAAFLLMVLIAGCAATRPTRYVDPQFDFSGIERVAVLPFENLATDQSTARYITRLFVTELLAQRVFEIVEPGDVSGYLAKNAIASSGEMTVDQMRQMAATLNVQGIIMGSVGESAQIRSGNLNSHIISLDTRMVSPETGATIWSAAVNTSGPGFFARVFGVGEQSRSAASKKAIRSAIKTLVK